MSVFSNMESVALFVNDVKDPNVTNHPHCEIPLPLWMFLLFGRKCFQHSGWCVLLFSLERSTEIHHFSQKIWFRVYVVVSF